MEPKQYILSEYLSTKNLNSYQMTAADGGSYVVVNEEIANGFLKYLEAKQLMVMCNNNKHIICLICGGPFVVNGDLCSCHQGTPDCYNFHCFISDKAFLDVEVVFKKIKLSRKCTKNRRSRAMACGSHDANDLDLICKLQAGLCYYCMCPIYMSGDNRYSVDHIIPLSSGGCNWPVNIALTCKSCNLRKSWTSEKCYTKKIRSDKTDEWIDDHKEFLEFIKRHKRKEFASRCE